MITTDVDGVEGRIADLQRQVEVGFTASRGQLDILLQRADQQDRLLAEYQRRMEHELARRDEERVRDQIEHGKQAGDMSARVGRLELRVYMAVGAALALSELVAHFMH